LSSSPTVGARRAVPLRKDSANFKSASTKRINELRHTPSTPVWQRNYYEHVIRNEDELKAIREYILGNPARWNEDENNPVQTDCGRSQTKATPWST